MLDALVEAEQGRGRTHPNPIVGALVVSRGKVIAAGHHEKAGGPHAEVVALRKARERARGADLYVTLEPCNHHGRTPPCSSASGPRWPTIRGSPHGSPARAAIRSPAECRRAIRSGWWWTPPRVCRRQRACSGSALERRPWSRAPSGLPPDG